jgi:hypothetical protein
MVLLKNIMSAIEECGDCSLSVVDNNGRVFMWERERALLL